MENEIEFPKPNPMWKRMEENYIKALISGDKEAMEIAKKNFGPMPMPKHQGRAR
jgi:hypothetical protein